MAIPIRQYITRMTPKGWAMLGGSVAAAIVFLMLVMNFASAKSYTTLETGMDPAQTGKITSSLDAKGIGYQIQNGGTALAVDSSQVSQARIALATAGLLGVGSQQPGFSLLDKSALGASNFQQQVTYQRALEGQLDQTIEQIQGVDSATVNLVLPNQQAQLFGDNSQASTASVLLSDSSTLDPSAVKGIAELVASSVQGLSDQKVTITDSSGQLLWPSSGQGVAGGATSKQGVENQYDAQMAAAATGLLAQTLGPGKAQVVVNADVNANQATSDTLVYGKKGVALTQQTQTETLKGGNGTAGGTTGTIPAYAATAGSTSSNYNNKSSNTTYGVDKTVTHSVIAPGAVNNQTVSVLVDKSVPASAIPAIRSAVAGAVGLNAKRGDSLSISQIAFNNKPAATTASPASPTKMLGYAKYAVAGLGALLFLFFMRRNIKRREREVFAGQPTWLRELETPRPLAALASGVDDEPADIKRLRSPVNVPKRQVEELVERDPDRVAQQVRAWMSED
jgi:flagellar M-ring protein FliF